MRGTSGQLSWKNAEGSSHCLIVFRYCLETIRKAAGVVIQDRLCVSQDSKPGPSEFKVLRNIHYAIQIDYLPVGVLAVQFCQSVTIYFVFIFSIFPHARFGIGCPYFCFSKPQSAGKLAIAVTVSSLTSPHSTVPLL